MAALAYIPTAMCKSSPFPTSIPTFVVICIRVHGYFSLGCIDAEGFAEVVSSGHDMATIFLNSQQLMLRPVHNPASQNSTIDGLAELQVPALT